MKTLCDANYIIILLIFIILFNHYDFLIYKYLLLKSNYKKF